MNIAAISRNPKNSPGMCDKDRAILDSIICLLSLAGHNVQQLTEDEYSTDSRHYHVIINMSRNNSTLCKLAEAQSNGTIVVNTPQAVSNCSRKIFTDILQANRIPQPAFVVQSNKQNAPTNGYPLWIKKSEGWSEEAGDVCYASTPYEANKIIADFRKREIEESLLCKHIEGDIIKFYGIGKEFFRICRPNPDDTKFGLEKINGTPQNYHIDKEKLHTIALSAATAIGVEIYGGDAIITPEGNIYIIDLNDFPSFSAVRDEAAQAISDLINSKINNRKR